MERSLTPRLGHVDLNKLRVFAAVAEHEHVSRAAEALGLSQPTLSLQVRDLEHYYGVPLFDRVGRGVRLTEAGRLVHSYARKILALVVELDGLMDDLQGLRVGTLRLGASTTIGEYLLPHVLGLFRRWYPDIRVSVAIANTEQIADRLRHGDLHVGLIGEPLDDPELELEPWHEDHLVLIVPPDHRWAGECIAPPELGSETWIVREVGSATRDVMEQALTAAGVSIAIGLELGGTEAVKGAVAGGLGVAFVPACAVEQDLSDGRLGQVKVDGLEITRQFQLVRRRGRALTAAERAFLLLLQVRPEL